MVEQVLAVYPRPAVRVRVVAPAKYARVRKILWKEVAQPVDAVGAIARRPRLLAVPVQAVDRDNAGMNCVSRVDGQYGYKVELTR
jgi:hypothetical protein